MSQQNLKKLYKEEINKTDDRSPAEDCYSGHEMLIGNPKYTNCSKDQDLNESNKNFNFIHNFGGNIRQLTYSHQKQNADEEKNQEMGGLLNYFFQPQANRNDETDQNLENEVRQSFGGNMLMQEINMDSTNKKELQNRTVTISEIVDCNQQQNNQNNFQINKTFNPFTSNSDVYQQPLVDTKEFNQNEYNFNQNSYQDQIQNNRQDINGSNMNKQNYVIMQNMQNSIKIVKLKTDPSLQSNIIKKSFDESKSFQNQVQSSSNNKSPNEIIQDTFLNQTNDQNTSNNLQNTNQSLKNLQLNIKMDFEKSQIENQNYQSELNLQDNQFQKVNNFNEQNSKTSSQQRQLLQLNGNHNYHRVQQSIQHESDINSAKNEKTQNESLKLKRENEVQQNNRYQNDLQSEQMQSRKSNSQPRTSKSKKSRKNSKNGTIQSDKLSSHNQEIQNQSHTNLQLQIVELQNNLKLPTSIDPQRKQFYREHFQYKNTLSKDSSNGNLQNCEQSQRSEMLNVQIGNDFKNIKGIKCKKSPQTELLRGSNKFLVQNDTSPNGLYKLDKSSIFPQSLYESTDNQNQLLRSKDQNYFIDKNKNYLPPKENNPQRIINRKENNLQYDQIRVSSQISQPFKKKKKINNNEKEFCMKQLRNKSSNDRQNQMSQPYQRDGYAQNQYQQIKNSNNQSRNFYDQNHNQLFSQNSQQINQSNEIIRQATPKRSHNISQPRLEWQDTVMKVPQNIQAEKSQLYQENRLNSNGKAWPIHMSQTPSPDQVFYSQPFLTQPYINQPILLAQLPNPQQHPIYIAQYDNQQHFKQNQQNYQMMNNSYAPNQTQPAYQEDKTLFSKDQYSKLKQNTQADNERNHDQVTSKHDKPFRPTINQQRQKLQQTYQIHQQEFERMKELENYNQSQILLTQKDKESTISDLGKSQTLQKKEAKSNTQSIQQTQSINFSDGQDFQEVVPVQRNYKSSNSNFEQYFGNQKSEKSLSSQYKRKKQSFQNQQSQNDLNIIIDKQSDIQKVYDYQNQLRNQESDLQKEFLENNSYSRNQCNNSQNALKKFEDNLQQSGIISHQTSQSIIKSVSLKGHILAAKSPQFCNQLNFDNINHQSNQLEQQNQLAQITCLNLKTQDSNSKHNRSSQKSDKYIIENPFYDNYQNNQSNLISNNLQDEKSQQATLLVSQLQSIQINPSSITSQNSSQIGPNIQINSQTQKGDPHQRINSQQNSTILSEFYNQVNSSNNYKQIPVSENDVKSINKMQQSQQTLLKASTPGVNVQQFGNDSKSVTVDQRDFKNINQQNSNCVNRLSSFQSDSSDIMATNQQIQDLSSDQTISQQKVISSATRIYPQNCVKQDNQSQYRFNNLQLINSQLRDKAFEIQDIKEFKNDKQIESDGYQITQSSKNIHQADNKYQQILFNSENCQTSSENQSKSLIRDNCHEMILEFKRAKNNNAITNMERNIQLLQEKIKNKMERQGSKNLKSTQNLQPRATQLNKFQSQMEQSIHQSEDVLQSAKYKLTPSNLDDIHEQLYNQNSQGSLDQSYNNSQIEYNFHQLQTAKLSESNTQKILNKNSFYALGEAQANKENDYVQKFKQDNSYSVNNEVCNQNTERSFQKFSELQSSQAERELVGKGTTLEKTIQSNKINNQKLDLKSVYSYNQGKQLSGNEREECFRSGSHLQSSQSMCQEDIESISRSQIEIQVQEFLQQQMPLIQLQIKQL